MSLWDSLTGGLKNTFEGISDIWNGKNPFASGGGFNSLFEGAAGDLQDFAEGYTGERMARENLEAQQEQWDVQNALNERQFAEQKHQNWLTQWREDVAMQRKVADLKAAGLNPVLAAGGSGSPTSTVTVPSLKTAPAPQLNDYSSGIRGAVDQVFGLLSMKKDFAQKDAQIKLLQSEKDKVDAEAAGIRIDNTTRGEYNDLRNLGMKLDNQFVQESMPMKIQELTNHLDLQELKKIHSAFENELARIGVDLAELDRTYKELGITDLRKKIELDTLALLHKTQEYEAYKYARGFYENQYHVPTGFNMSSLFGALTAVGNLLGPKVKSFLREVFGKESAPRNPSGFGGTGASRDFDYPDPTSFVPLDFDEPYIYGPSVGEVIKNFVSSYRRGADGVRRNQYSVLFK